MGSYSVNLTLFLLLIANGCLLILNKSDEQPAAVFNKIAEISSNLVGLKILASYAESITIGVAIVYCILGLAFLLKLKWPGIPALVLSILMIATIDNPYFNKLEYHKEISVITHLLIIGIVCEIIQSDNRRCYTGLSKIKVE
eukprot:TRINITY_DN2373_c0_g2_i5.p1 TRINITY_DN2373_c0_g2~~TRINITY_DN2373_c0_g2_i5.p1  ORF type:complete len:142 (-),score=13.36 TRINITY_DN2373_c0_g2_i5:116-541(-)